MTLEIDPNLFLCFIRALGFITIVPWSGSPVFNFSKLLLAFGLALCAFDSSSYHHTPDILDYLQEFFIGLLVGLPGAVFVCCISVFGELFDLSRGQSIGVFIDPLSNNQQSQMGIFGSSLSWTVLLLGDGIYTLINNFQRSISMVPPGSLQALEIALAGKKMFFIVCENLNDIFAAFLPLALIFLMIDLCSGILQKTIPNISLSSESFQAKTLLGMLTIFFLSPSNLTSSIKALSEISFTAFFG